MHLLYLDHVSARNRGLYISFGIFQRLLGLLCEVLKLLLIYAEIGILSCLLKRDKCTADHLSRGDGSRLCGLTRGSPIFSELHKSSLLPILSASYDTGRILVKCRKPLDLPVL